VHLQLNDVFDFDCFLLPLVSINVLWKVDGLSFIFFNVFVYKATLTLCEDIGLWVKKWEEEIF